MSLQSAMAARDLGAVRDALAPDVVLRSPITSRLRFEGREQVTEVLGAVLETLEDLRYIEEVENGPTQGVFFSARVRGGAELEGADLIRLDEEGKVRELTVFIRPLPGLAAFAAALGPRVARRRGRARGAVLALMTRPLAAAIRSGDGIATRLARPAA